MSFEDITFKLEKLCGLGDEIKADTTRWVGEVLVMTAPYFGLPKDVADTMRSKLGLSEIMPSKTALRVEQKRMVNNAIILGQTGFARSERKSLDGGQEPSSPDFDAAVDEFLRQRRAMSLADSEWWKWLSERERSRHTSSTTAAGKKRSAKKTPPDKATSGQ